MTFDGLLAALGWVGVAAQAVSAVLVFPLAVRSNVATVGAPWTEYVRLDGLAWFGVCALVISSGIPPVLRGNVPELLVALIGASWTCLEFTLIRALARALASLHLRHRPRRDSEPPPSVTGE